MKTKDDKRKSRTDARTSRRHIKSESLSICQLLSRGGGREEAKLSGQRRVRSREGGGREGLESLRRRKGNGRKGGEVCTPVDRTLQPRDQSERAKGRRTGWFDNPRSPRGRVSWVAVPSVAGTGSHRCQSSSTSIMNSSSASATRAFDSREDENCWKGLTPLLIQHLRPSTLILIHLAQSRLIKDLLSQPLPRRTQLPPILVPKVVHDRET